MSGKLIEKAVVYYDVVLGKRVSWAKRIIWISFAITSLAFVIDWMINPNQWSIWVLLPFTIFIGSTVYIFSLLNTIDVVSMIAFMPKGEVAKELERRWAERPNIEVGNPTSSPVDIE